MRLSLLHRDAPSFEVPVMRLDRAIAPKFPVRRSGNFPADRVVQSAQVRCSPGTGGWEKRWEENVMVQRQPPAPAVWQLSICVLAAGCMGAGLDSLTASAIPPKASLTTLDGRMTEIPGSAPIEASADTATIVFLRPWPGPLDDRNWPVAIVDESGNWLGDVLASSLFSVRLPPGDYMFIAWSTQLLANTEAVKATVSAGRVYYVELYGSLSMQALTPHHEDWRSLPYWLDDTRRLEPVAAAGKAYYEGKRDDVLDRVKAGQENWDGYTSRDKHLRTLEPDGGVVGKPRYDL
jgi:hypothetical protein